jgi:hypothetical protein
MNKFIIAIFFLALNTGLKAQITKPVANNTETVSSDRKKGDSTKPEYLKYKLIDVIISSATTSKTYTTGNVISAIKGIQISKSQLTAAEGYEFILSSDAKSVTLQTNNKTGTNTTIGKFECICPLKSGICKVTMANGVIGCLSTGCTECVMNASIGNTKCQFKFK